MKNSHRYITSLLMTSIYLLIVLIPLAPCALQSRYVAHALTGECSGDCKVDGCSLERSAAHTCCCWQKKRSNLTDKHHSKADVCDTHLTPPNEVPQKVSSCCGVKDKHVDRGTSESAANTTPQKSRTTTISCRPCGSGKLIALLSNEASQHVPFFFTGEISSPEQDILSLIQPDRLTSRYGEPPDPPPIITIFS